MKNAPCAVVRPWESFIIGAIGGIIAIATASLMDRLRIDDPVGAVAVHGSCGAWGMLSVGLFVDIDPLEDTTNGQRGLFHNGGVRLLGVQALACVAIMAWSALTTFIILFAIDKTVGIRLSLEDERLGTDFVEHGIGSETDLYFFETRSQHGSDKGGGDPTVSIRRRSRGALGFQRTFILQSSRLCGRSDDVTEDAKLKAISNGNLDIPGKTNPIFVNDDGVISSN